MHTFCSAHRLLLPLVLLAMACARDPKSAQVEPPTDDSANLIQSNPAFVERLMPLLGKGVTGGDGCISIDLKNGKSLFMWGDCFLGDVVDNKRVAPAPLVMGNVFTVLSDDTVVSYYKGTREQPLSWITPQPMGADTICWYWPGHGFVRDGVLHLFMSQFYRSGQGMFDFRYVACDYFRLNANTLEVIDKRAFPAANINGVHYGHAVLDDGAYIYSYGTLADAAGVAVVHVARARLVANVLTDWHYYNGTDWSTNPATSQPLRGIQRSVSEQFNVIKHGDTYILISQTRDMDNKVFSALADSPSGPFYNEKEIFAVGEPLAEKKMITYNTMVHPQYTDKGRMLMCYNVNTLDFMSLFDDATLYRPRFFWMPMSKILSE